MRSFPARWIHYLGLILSASMVVSIPVSEGTGNGYHDYNGIRASADGKYKLETQPVTPHVNNKHYKSEDTYFKGLSQEDDGFHQAGSSGSDRSQNDWQTLTWMLRALSEMKRGKPAFNPTGWRRKKRSVVNSGEKRQLLDNDGKRKDLRLVLGKIKDILRKYDKQVVMEMLGGSLGHSTDLRSKKDAYQKARMWRDRMGLSGLTRNNGRIVQRQGPNFNPTGW